MLAYNLRLALQSLRRTPGIAALMIGAIALGVGVCVTSLTVYRLMSGNPIAHRNDVLYAVTLDSFGANDPADDERPWLPPPQMTYRDTMALSQSDIPDRQAAMRKGAFVLDPVTTEGVRPFSVLARFTTRDFFAMFDVPFAYGSGWDKAADLDAESVVVLSKETNVKAFGGGDSVGKTLRLDGRDYKVIGVLDEWEPIPKFYDLNNGVFDSPEAIFVPLAVGTELEMVSAGSTQCWKQEQINSFKDFIGSDCIWMQYWVELGSADKVAAFQDFMDNYVREQKRLGRFERPLNNHLRKPDEWLDVNEAVQDDNKVLVGLSFMFLAVCLLNMIGLLLAKFLGVAALVGLRRALGASRKVVFQQHIVEVAVVGVCGGVLGLAIAALGLLGVRSAYDNYEALTRLDVTMGLIALTIAVVSGVLAGLYPTWRVCRIQPAMYLKTQ